MIDRRRIGAFAYGTLFCVLLPWLLVQWASATHSIVEMPAYGTPAGGIVLIAAGGTLMALGFIALVRRGGGFMNAIPPKRLVTTDIYRWLPHPMYLGFAIATLGVAMLYQSPSGLWLVAPAVMLGCAAVVFGHEAPDLERRFGPAARDYNWLPADHPGSPAGMARIRCCLFLLLPWVAIYEIIVWSGQPKDAFTLSLPFERAWPVFPIAEPIYMSTYIVVALTPLLARTSSSLRQFMVRAWLAMLISFSLYLVLPVLAPHKPFIGSGFWGKALDFERSADPPLNAFPSFHTVWAFLTAELLIVGRSRTVRFLWRAWAVAIAVSCVATGAHWIADVVAGFLLSLALIHGDRIWSAALQGTERFANSWSEWEAGPFRIAHHALYVGFAAGIALLIAGTLSGPENAAALILASAGGFTGASLWSRFTGGRLRPDSWFGGLVGVGLLSLCAPLAGGSAIVVAAALCTAAPWMQAIGRLRCLVEGRGFGRPALSIGGIVYREPRTLPARYPGLRERPLHPTPIYSMLWSIFAGLVLARMWWVGCPLRLITGVYLLLWGMGRFVEETYRHRPEMRVAGKLLSTQWLAAAVVGLGALLTALPLSGDAPSPHFNWGAVAAACAFGVIGAASLGIDVAPREREAVAHSSR